MHDDASPGIDHGPIIDQIYEVALEPWALEDFIEFWHSSGLDRHYAAVHEDGTSSGEEVLRTHLERAQIILQREGTRAPDLAQFLKPVQSMAAFVTDKALHICAATEGAQAGLGLQPGGSIERLSLPSEIRLALSETIQKVLTPAGPPEQLLKIDLADKAGSLLFRVSRIATPQSPETFALVVSNQFHWRAETGALLGRVFQLTLAEQDVVRLLLMGHETKAIAAARRTSEGTVRGQIKTILSKTNLRSQADIVRLVMSLSDFAPAAAEPGDTHPAPESFEQSGWLEAEVWKPMDTLALGDGRTLTYLDMGPRSGNPVLMSHMGSCMARWSPSMIRLAFKENLRVICPIRAGYGHSSSIPAQADPLATASRDCIDLLDHLGIGQVPFVAQGTDFPFAADLAARHPGTITEVIGIGARPCLPGGESVEGAGRWQQFFVSTARNAPQLVQFASKAVMAMCKRIGPEAMLRQLCRDSAADLAILEIEEMKPVLVANISLMAGRSTNAGRAFAREYIAFQTDWSASVLAMKDMPVQVFVADEDPTFDQAGLPRLAEAYPWMRFEVLREAGLALLYQKYEVLIPAMAAAAVRAAQGAKTPASTTP